jgi:hypothetical protein
VTQEALPYTLLHDVHATRISGTPATDRLVGWYEEHESVILPAGTRFAMATDPRDVGPPSTTLVLTASGWYRAYAQDLAREISSRVPHTTRVVSVVWSVYREIAIDDRIPRYLRSQSVAVRGRALVDRDSSQLVGQ